MIMNARRDLGPAVIQPPGRLSSALMKTLRRPQAEVATPADFVLDLQIARRGNGCENFLGRGVFRRICGAQIGMDSSAAVDP